MSLRLAFTAAIVGIRGSGGGGGEALGKKTSQKEKGEGRSPLLKPWARLCQASLSPWRPPGGAARVRYYRVWPAEGGSSLLKPKRRREQRFSQKMQVSGKLTSAEIFPPQLDINLLSAFASLKGQEMASEETARAKVLSAAARVHDSAPAGARCEDR